MPSREIVEKAYMRPNRVARRRMERAVKRSTTRHHRWDELIARVPADRRVQGAEIGVLRGLTAAKVLAARPMATHYMIDPWEKPKEGSRYAEAPGSTQRMSQAQFDECYEHVCRIAHRYGQRAVVVRDYSRSAALLFEPHSLFYVFIDGDHTYEGVRDDIIAWLPKVEKGGWIGGHDYDNLPNHPGVKKAVDEAFPDGVERGVDHTWWVRL